jgi:hypothetical protein
LWFVTELDAVRVTSDEKRGIKLIPEALGGDVWSRSLIVFTFADKVEASEFEDDLSERTELIREEIRKYSPHHVDEIPSVAVSNKDPTFPNGKKWLGELFTQVFVRSSTERSFYFFDSMKNDIGDEKRASKASANDIEGAKRIDIDSTQKGKMRGAWSGC